MTVQECWYEYPDGTKADDAVTKNVITDTGSVAPISIPSRVIDTSASLSA